MPDSDYVIRISSKEGLAISGPSHRQALRRISFAVLCVLRDDFVLELIDHGLALKIPDLDGGSGSSAEPVAVGGEAQGVDDVGVVEGVQPLVVVQVPQHGFAVLQRNKIKKFGKNNYSTIHTLPPEAHREPSGETVTVFR